ncbi:MAG: lamin tail domain-containing protein [Ardenticatenaceae bacterium]|nr:lamin tail domain-containing protein [Ardenticatenaceae bacterium]
MQRFQFGPKQSIWLCLFIVSLLTVSPTYALNRAAANPAAGQVLINEFVARSSVTEWVELFNTTGSDLDISGFYIDDVTGGGGSPKVIPANTIIPANGYYVMEFTNLLNNGGDDVNFLDPSQVIFDSKSYSSSTAEYSYYRSPDGGAWSSVETDSPTKGSTNNVNLSEPWVPGNFEIRIFDVEQGDSQLIIFPSGYTILIDVREASWNTGAGAAFIAQKIRDITGGSHVNVGVLSHHHLDHIGYAGYGGFWGLLEVEGITFDKIVDRNAGQWVDGSNGGTVDGLCDPDFEIDWNWAGTNSGTSRNWLCYATNPANTNIYPIREIAQVGSTTQIDPPDVGALVTISQADAEGITLVDGVTPLRGDHTALALPPSENDYSIALKITYEDIDYATAGDTDGEYATSTFGYTYNDVETDLADRFGGVDIMRANHHGSDHSTNQYYVDTLNPDVSAISCGANSYGHPSQRVLNALLGTGDVYLTNYCSPATNYAGAVLVEGDIIIRSADGSNYTVNGVNYVANPNNGGGGGSYSISDILINELYPNANSGEPEWIELYNPTAQAIDISGGFIDDIAGGGGAAKVIPPGTVIPAGGHWTMDTSNFFNNGGDDARLLESDGVTVVDSYTYGSSTKGSSFYRSPDGGTWAGSAGAPTKGTTNP